MGQNKRTCIIVLMAGKGQRFVDGGYVDVPKWALTPPWTDRTLLDLSLRALVELLPTAHVCFVVRADDLVGRSPLSALTALPLRSHSLVALQTMRNGPLDSLMAAWTSTVGYEQVLIQVCDTFIPSLSWMAPSAETSVGTVFCFDHDHEHFCHVDIDGSTGTVVGLREKVGPLTHGSCGLFLVRDLPLFELAMSRVMSQAAPRMSGEYYIADAINEMLSRSQRLDALIIEGAAAVGTPSEFACPPRAWTLR